MEISGCSTDTADRADDGQRVQDDRRHSEVMPIIDNWMVVLKATMMIKIAITDSSLFRAGKCKLLKVWHDIDVRVAGYFVEVIDSDSFLSAMIMIIRMMSGMSATVMSYKFSSLTLTAQVVHKTVLFPSGGRQCQVPWGSRAVHPRNLPGGPGQDEDPDHAAPLHRQDDLQRLHLLQQLRPHLLPPGQDHQPDHHQLQEVSSHYCRGGKLI